MSFSLFYYFICLILIYQPHPPETSDSESEIMSFGSEHETVGDMENEGEESHSIVWDPRQEAVGDHSRNEAVGVAMDEDIDSDEIIPSTQQIDPRPLAGV